MVPGFVIDENFLLQYLIKRLFYSFSAGNFQLREQVTLKHRTPEVTKSGLIPFTGEWLGWGQTIFDTLIMTFKTSSKMDILVM